MKGLRTEAGGRPWPWPLAAACVFWLGCSTGVAAQPAPAQPAQPAQPAPAQPAPAQPVVPGGVVLPTLVEARSPAYPAGLDGRSAELELSLTLDPAGLVIEVRVVARVPEDAAPELEAAAVEAARGLRFTPALRDGAPIAARIGYRMRVQPPQLGVITAPNSAAGMAVESAAQSGQVVDTAADGGRDPAASPAAATTASAADGGGDPAASAAAVAAASAADSGEGSPRYGATGRSRTLVAPPARAAGDFFVPVGHLHEVPRANASDFLRLAPGILLTNDGGEGHAERVYLRGFDAREGQDLEFTLDGVPINEVGNPHGEGYADTHFILPELVRAVRVLEGPFDPRQGNYAVAGSAEYMLGLDQRGLSVSAQAGSFDTQRLVLLWGPEGEHTGTFVGADVRRTDGFGQNRAAQLARGMGQYELSLGEGRRLRVLATSYATRFGSAGVVREDDLHAGAIDFYGTYDPSQGGTAQRHGVSLVYEQKRETWTLRQQVFATLRNLRLRDNFTGFLEDPPEPFRSGSAQRGDMNDQVYAATTLGARGSLRQATQLFGQPQSLELGYYARHDAIDASQRRLRFGTVVPYRVDFDYTHAITNLALYADTELRATPWLGLRGGLRADLLQYDTLDRCALHDAVLSGVTPAIDQLCYTRDRVGPRDPTSRRSASGLALQPRGTLIVGPFAGLQLVAALGRGVRAADPSYLGDGDQAPFSSILGAEGGAVWNQRLHGVQLNVRGLYYYTHVGRDLIFDQQEGRNTLAPGTRRQGMLLAARAQARFFDVSVSGTYAHARFERDDTLVSSAYRPADAGARVPYIPAWVMRLDAALFDQLMSLRLFDRPLRARASLGLSYVSPRALLFGERGEPMFVADAALGLGLGPVELGVAVANLFDNRYRLSEYNYVSEFRQDSIAPNLIPVRHFTAGAPRSVLFTLTWHFGGTGASS